MSGMDNNSTFVSLVSIANSYLNPYYTIKF